MDSPSLLVLWEPVIDTEKYFRVDVRKSSETKFEDILQDQKSSKLNVDRLYCAYFFLLDRREYEYDAIRLEVIQEAETFKYDC